MRSLHSHNYWCGILQPSEIFSFSSSKYILVFGAIYIFSLSKSGFSDSKDLLQLQEKMSNVIKNKQKLNEYVYIQGVPLILVQTLRGGRGHEDKYY